MNITVKTDSGSVYRFSQINGKTFVVKKGEWSGEVIAFQKDPIRIGKSIEMLVRRVGVFKKGENAISPLSTTIVKDVYANL